MSPVRCSRGTFKKLKIGAFRPESFREQQLQDRLRTHIGTDDETKFHFHFLIDSPKTHFAPIVFEN